MELNRSVAKLMAPIARRVRLLARRGIVKIVHDDRKMQELQLAIFSDEVRDGVERFQNYGVTSHPHPGAEAIVLALSGSTEHSVAIVVDDRRYRITNIAPGEVAIYTDEGDFIHLKRGRLIHVSTGGKLLVDAANEVEINTAAVKINASTSVEVNTPVATINASTKADIVTLAATVRAPAILLDGNVQITGTLGVAQAITGQGISAGAGIIHANNDVIDGVRSMKQDRAIYNSHTHNDPQGGAVGVPNQQQ
jgi:phage baseplate assembly protein V